MWLEMFAFSIGMDCIWLVCLVYPSLTTWVHQLWWGYLTPSNLDRTKKNSHMPSNPRNNQSFSINACKTNPKLCFIENDWVCIGFDCIWLIYLVSPSLALLGAPTVVGAYDSNLGRPSKINQVQSNRMKHQSVSISACKTNAKLDFIPHHLWWGC